MTSLIKNPQLLQAALAYPQQHGAQLVQILISKNGSCQIADGKHRTFATYTPASLNQMQTLADIELSSLQYALVNLITYKFEPNADFSSLVPHIEKMEYFGDAGVSFIGDPQDLSRNPAVQKHLEQLKDASKPNSTPDGALTQVAQALSVAGSQSNISPLFDIDISDVACVIPKKCVDLLARLPDWDPPDIDIPTNPSAPPPAFDTQANSGELPSYTVRLIARVVEEPTTRMFLESVSDSDSNDPDENSSESASARNRREAVEQVRQIENITTAAAPRISTLMQPQSAASVPLSQESDDSSSQFENELDNEGPVVLVSPIEEILVDVDAPPPPQPPSVLTRNTSDIGPIGTSLLRLLDTREDEIMGEGNRENDSTLATQHTGMSVGANTEFVSPTTSQSELLGDGPATQAPSQSQRDSRVGPMTQAFTQSQSDRFLTQESQPMDIDGPMTQAPSQPEGPMTQAPSPTPSSESSSPRQTSAPKRARTVAATSSTISQNKVVHFARSGNDETYSGGDRGGGGEFSANQVDSQPFVILETILAPSPAPPTSNSVQIISSRPTPKKKINYRKWLDSAKKSPSAATAASEI